MKVMKWLLIFVDVFMLSLFIYSLLTPRDAVVAKFKRRGLYGITENSEPSPIRNAGQLTTTSKEYINYDDEYEEKIFNNSESNIFNHFDIKIDGYNAHLIVVYDPSKIKLMVGNGFNTKNNTGKMTVKKMVAKYNALAGINAGGFFDNGKMSTDRPMGYVVQDGKITWDIKGRKGKLIGFNEDNELILVNATSNEFEQFKIRDAIEFGPFLMINGVETEDAQKMANKRASRVLIAQRDDKVVLMLATDGGTFGGPRMSKIIDTLKNYGAVTIANLDGGASSQIVVGNTNYITPRDVHNTLVVGGRTVVTAWGVFE